MDLSVVTVLTILQLFFSIVIGLYFWNMLKSQQGTKRAVIKESKSELNKLRAMRRISLTEPLAEKTRPARFQDIIGQEEGLEALKAAICGPNPQHVIIYGPPGVKKLLQPDWFWRLPKDHQYLPLRWMLSLLKSMLPQPVLMKGVLPIP